MNGFVNQSCDGAQQEALAAPVPTAAVGLHYSLPGDFTPMSPGVFTEGGAGPGGRL